MEENALQIFLSDLVIFCTACSSMIFSKHVASCCILLMPPFKLTIIVAKTGAPCAC